MKLFALLISAYVAAAALASKECCSNRGENLIQFNGRGQDIFFPCKYWALKRQQCGKYLITLSPGNRWIYPKYQLDTIWLGVEDSETGEFWEGRTTNKLAVKYFNSEGMRELFQKKNGTMATSQVLEFGRDGSNGLFIKDREGTFKVTFTPFDPKNRANFPDSDWKFECFDDNALVNEYPSQLCGGDDETAVADRAKEVFGLSDEFTANVIYYDTFTGPALAHTNPQCKTASDVLLNTCRTRKQRMQAISNCQDILRSQPYAECVSKYSCDPMVIFNACILWGCTGTGFDPANQDMCNEVAKGIQFCPEFGSSGNLTARVEAAKCNKDFVSIRPELVSRSSEKP